MNIKKYITITTVLGLILFSIQVCFAQSEQGVTLSKLVNRALEHNPKIQQQQHLWRAAEYRIRYVKGLPDPQASFTHFEKSVETRVGPQERKYGFSQKIPFPGKLNLKGKAQQAKADVARTEYEAVKREVIKNVKWTFYEIYWIDTSLKIAQEEKTILESIEQTSQRRYELNQLPYRDMMKAQVELSKIIERIFTLTAHRKSLAARMNGLLNRPKDALIPEITQVDFSEFVYDLDSILERARQTQPEYIAAQSKLQKSKHEKSLARMDYLPDFTFGANYIDVGGGSTAASNDGRDAFMGMVSINVPIWFGKLKAHLNEKKEKYKAAKKGLEAQEDQLTVDVQDLYYKITTYKDIVLLYETAIVPQAKSAYEATQLGFESDETDFLNFLDAQRTYLQTRLAYHKAVVDYQKSIAHLERVIGEDL